MLILDSARRFSAKQRQTMVGEKLLCS